MHITYKQKTCSAMMNILTSSDPKLLAVIVRDLATNKYGFCLIKALVPFKYKGLGLVWPIWMILSRLRLARGLRLGFPKDSNRELLCGEISTMLRLKS